MRRLSVATQGRAQICPKYGFSKHFSFAEWPFQWPRPPMGEAITQIKNIPTETQRSAAFSAKMVSRETDFKIEHSEKLLLRGVESGSLWFCNFFIGGLHTLSTCWRGVKLHFNGSVCTRLWTWNLTLTLSSDLLSGSSLYYLWFGKLLSDSPLYYQHQLTWSNMRLSWALLTPGGFYCLVLWIIKERKIKCLHFADVK